MAVEFRRALGGRIRVARKTRLNSISLEVFGQQVAEAVGRGRAFSNVTVSNWETGRQEPSWESLVAIAQLTQLPLRYFAGIGNVEDFPLAHGLDPERNELDARLRTLVSAVQRLEPRQQQLVVRQIETLVSALGDREQAKGSGNRARAERS